MAVGDAYGLGGGHHGVEWCGVVWYRRLGLVIRVTELQNRCSMRNRKRKLNVRKLFSN